MRSAVMRFPVAFVSELSSNTRAQGAHAADEFRELVSAEDVHVALFPSRLASPSMFQQVRVFQFLGGEGSCACVHLFVRVRRVNETEKA
jgi:hypothetical protein